MRGMSREKKKRAAATLHESDFLLGVYDLHRMGALRCKLDPKGEASLFWGLISPINF
jgi:hypothetical protein